MHDLLHYAFEGEAGLTNGVWGRLAAGTSLAHLNDRSAPLLTDDQDLAMVETLVGAMTSLTKGTTPASLVDNLQANADAFDWPLPTWLTPDFAAAVQRRMHHLMGHWRGTAHGEVMELPWPPSR